LEALHLEGSNQLLIKLKSGLAPCAHDPLT
jgi:hypothetical protein